MKFSKGFKKYLSTLDYDEKVKILSVSLSDFGQEKTYKLINDIYERHIREEQNKPAKMILKKVFTLDFWNREISPKDLQNNFDVFLLQKPYRLVNSLLDRDNNSRGSRFNSAIIATDVIKSLSDLEYSRPNKKYILSKYFSPESKYISDESHDESLPGLGKKENYSKISSDQYKVAVKDVDQSEYIILTASLLKELYAKSSKNDNAIQEMLNEIDKNYFGLKYEKCIEDILKVSSKMQLDEDLTMIIAKMSENCKPISPKENYSRRFFETKFSQYILGTNCSDEMFFGSISKISKHFLSLPIENIDDLKRKIAFISADDSSTAALDILQYFKTNSESYGRKNTSLKSGFIDRDMEEKAPDVSNQITTSASAYSQNLGVLTANQPNFRNEISNLAIRNRVPDINEISNINNGYSNSENRDRAAFVSSISGHTFYMLARLYLLCENTKSSEIETDVNNFILAYLATYCNMGYHGINEVLDVLRDPYVINEFKQNLNIDLKVTFDSSCLSDALNDTMEYTKLLKLNKNLGDELLQKQSLITKSFKHNRNNGQTPIVQPLAHDPERDNNTKNSSSISKKKI